MILVHRVEKQVIRPSHPYYDMLDEYCFMAKNLYNHANYVIRQEFIHNGKYLPYETIDKILKSDIEYPDYQSMPTAQSAQQTLRLLGKNWKSFFKAIKDWKAHKEKYNGRPKLPRYKKKDGRSILILTNQNVKLSGNILLFPKAFNGLTLKIDCVYRDDFAGFNQIRFLPKKSHIVVEVVYSIAIEKPACDNGRYCSIDVGIDNLAAVTTNTGSQPYVINGKGLRSIHRYYSKKIAYYGSIAEKTNGRKFTKRMRRIADKRNRKVNDYMHKASRYIVNDCIDKDIHTIVIGYNKNWKQDADLGRENNQIFVGIPTKRLIDMITYKAQEAHIAVVLVNESYTSGTSFLDNEMPVKRNYDKSRRIHRGLFVSDKGIKINADVNASYQILKKAFPNAYANGIEGVMLHPVRVAVACI